MNTKYLHLYFFVNLFLTFFPFYEVSKEIFEVTKCFPHIDFTWRYISVCISIFLTVLIVYIRKKNCSDPSSVPSDLMNVRFVFVPIASVTPWSRWASASRAM